MPYPTDRERDRPWVIRTYAGHSSAQASNALYRRNLAKGQTGLSVAFDLPTQTGYDPDDELARGEVGKVGVPVAHLGDMRALFDGIPLADANTSMTINAPAMWLLALYVAVAEEQGADPRAAGRHHAERHRQGVPVARDLRLPARPEHAADHRHDRLVVHEPAALEPDQHLQLPPAGGGATPEQELAYALSHGDRRARLGARLRAGAARGVRRPSWGASRSSSTPGCASSRRCARCARSPGCGTRSPASATASTDAKARRLRYGVQVNSLGLTEAQPENNVQRIVLEMLAVTLSRDARARAVQLPAWNEALGLPRPWDQQWALRMQQVLAYETDLLEYEDLFDGSHVVEAKVAELVAGARAEIDRVAERGGAVAAVESGYMKGQLVALARGAAAADGVGRGRRRRGEPVRDHRAQPVADRCPGDRDGRPGGGGRRPSRRSGRGAPGATPPPSRPRWTSCAPPPRPTPTSWSPRSPARRRA